MIEHPAEHPVIGIEEEFFPDLIVPILAWRSWKLQYTKQSVSLQALYKNDIWPPKEPLVGYCTEQKHGTWERVNLLKDRWVCDETAKTPVRECMCGIHAGRSVWWTINYSQNPAASIFGTCMLWGRVFRHKKGYRGQYAYPHTLFAIEDRLKHPQETILQLEEKYGLQITMVQNWAEIVDTISGPWQDNQESLLTKALQYPS